MGPDDRSHSRFARIGFHGRLIQGVRQALAGPCTSIGPNHELAPETAAYLKVLPGTDEQLIAVAAGDAR